jgi:hypothetical protein
MAVSTNVLSSSSLRLLCGSGTEAYGDLGRPGTDPFSHASTYTPNLSAFIELAQLLVIWRFFSR